MHQDRVQKADARFMKEALRQGRKGLGRTSPNPSVGAVIVKDGEIISTGYHRGIGLPHAEIEALSKIGWQAGGGTLYVTLEPCNHHGKTPPCTEAIIGSGINRVVAGIKDPNPGVAGGGCEFLRQNRISVTTGVLEGECRRLHEAFLKFVISKRPFVLMKSAQTLDGWTATATGHSRWITSSESRQAVHRLRDRVDAVMVGVGTVMADDPRLTTRLKRGRGKDPLRIVLDTHLRTPRNSKVLNHNSSADTLIVVGSRAAERQAGGIEKRGVSVFPCPIDSGRIDLKALMGILGEMSVTSVLVEGGALVMGSILQHGLADKIYIFKAPKIFGGDDGVPMASGKGPVRMEECLVLKDLRIRRYGTDVLMIGYPDYGKVRPVAKGQRFD